MYLYTQYILVKIVLSKKNMNMKSICLEFWEKGAKMCNIHFTKD